MNVNKVLTKDYENISDWTLSENKPNSKPNKANLHLTAENAEYAEKKDISVSDCSIEKYALYAISPCSLRTRRLMKNKANTKPIKANVKIGKINISIAVIKDYDNEQQTTNNERYSKQTQFKPKQSQFPIILVSLNWLCIISPKVRKLGKYFNGDFSKWQKHRRQMQ